MPSKKNKSKKQRSIKERAIGKKQASKKIKATQKNMCGTNIKNRKIEHDNKNNEKLQYYKKYINSLTPIEKEKLEFNLILLFMMLMMVKMENKKNIIIRYHKLKDKNIIDSKYDVDDFLQSYTNFKKCVPLKKKNSLKKKIVKKIKRDKTKGETKVEIKGKTKKTKKTKNTKKTIKGGAYLKRLEDLGDKPITGNDLKKSLDEITDILDGLKYTPKGSNIKPFSMFLNLFRGNEYDLNYRIQMQEAPQYFDYIPPTLNIKNIIKLIPDLVEYITIYLNHKRKVKEYLVDSGEMKPEDIEPNTFEVMAQQFQDKKDIFDSKVSNISNPKNMIKRQILL